MAEQHHDPVQDNEPSRSELLQIRRDKLADLRREGRDPFIITKYRVTARSADIRADFEALEGSRTSVAGRLMS